MLKEIYKLKPFFEDNYLELGVREYARLVKTTPPTASKILKNFESQGFLKKKSFKKNLLFRANKESKILKDLSRIYWSMKLNDLINFIENGFHPSLIILFGSLTNLEINKNSDIDIAIISKFNPKMDFSRFEKKLKKEIQLFRFDSIEKINKELRNSILNGYVLRGSF